MVTDISGERRATVADTSIRGRRIVRALAMQAEGRGAPTTIVGDDGEGHRPSEPTSNALLAHSGEVAVATQCILPDRPVQAGHAQRFNGRTRDELPDETLFTDIAHARPIVPARVNDGAGRPPSSSC